MWNFKGRLWNSSRNILWVSYFVWNFKGPIEIPHRISYPYIARYDFYAKLKFYELLYLCHDLGLNKRWVIIVLIDEESETPFPYPTRRFIVKSSKSRKPAKMGVKWSYSLKFDSRLRRNVAETVAKFQIDWENIDTYLAPSRLCESIRIRRLVQYQIGHQFFSLCVCNKAKTIKSGGVFLFRAVEVKRTHSISS